GRGLRLGLHVGAEGVETAAIMEEVRQLGCHTAQGYFLARALGAKELVAWLNARAEHAAAPVSGSAANGAVGARDGGVAAVQRAARSLARPAHARAAKPRRSSAR